MPRIFLCKLLSLKRITRHMLKTNINKAFKAFMTSVSKNLRSNVSTAMKSSNHLLVYHVRSHLMKLYSLMFKVTVIDGWAIGLQVRTRKISMKQWKIFHSMCLLMKHRSRKYPLSDGFFDIKENLDEIIEFFRKARTSLALTVTPL